MSQSVKRGNNLFTRVTAPAETPISLDEAKAHLRVDTSDEDSTIELYIAAATESIDGAEGTLGRCIVTQQWDYSFDSFQSPITVPLPRLISVDSITYRDVNGITQTLSSSAYSVFGQSISPIDGWPDTDGMEGAVTVRFTAGYGNAASVPAPIKSALLLLVGELYKTRQDGASVSNIPATRSLLLPYKVTRL